MEIGFDPAAIGHRSCWHLQSIEAFRSSSLQVNRLRVTSSLFSTVILAPLQRSGRLSSPFDVIDLGNPFPTRLVVLGRAAPNFIILQTAQGRTTTSSVVAKRHSTWGPPQLPTLRGLPRRPSSPKAPLHRDKVSLGNFLVDSPKEHRPPGVVIGLDPLCPTSTTPLSSMIVHVHRHYTEHITLSIVTAVTRLPPSFSLLPPLSPCLALTLVRDQTTTLARRAARPMQRQQQRQRRHRLRPSRSHHRRDPARTARARLTTSHHSSAEADS